MTALRQYANLWRAALSGSLPDRYAARFLVLFIHTLLACALIEVLTLALAAA